MRSRRLLLLGGGHAHVQVVRSFAADPPAADVLLLSDTRLAPYSGMLPGLVAGHYRHEEAHIDLPALCAAARVRFVQGRAISLDPAARRVGTEDGTVHAYDILAIDTGSRTAVEAIPGAAERAVAVKPVDGFLRSVDALVERVREGRAGPIAIVGAGAAGVELAFALEHRLRDVGLRPAMDLYCDRDGILPGFPARARRIATDLLRQRNIGVRIGAAVAGIDGDGVRLADGSRADADAIVVATGASPLAVYRECGLQTDARGCIEVHPTLQSVSHPDIFASGDVAAVRGYPRPKAGVFAVRQGPPLAANLARALQGQPLLPHVPQREYLVLLGTGDRHAIAVRNGWTMHGRWVWRWKEHIDRRFVAGFTPAAVAALRRS